MGVILLRYGVFAPLGASSLLLLVVLAWMDAMGPEGAEHGSEHA